MPSGRYRLTRTIYVWRGVRVIGYGATRPVFVLADNTPGYQQGIGLMVMFSGGGPAALNGGGGRGGRGGRVPFPPPGTVPPNDNIPDASPGTFYPAMSNIDFEIGDGNPAAIAIRFHVAQHGSLSHMDFHVGSGLAALTEIGNEAEDLHVYGGRYGILTDNTSPFWQFTLIDSVFEGQREAAIREHMAQLTLIRDTFRNVPTAIDIDPHYSDELWVKDSRFENVSHAAVIISNEKNPWTAGRRRQRGLRERARLRPLPRERQDPGRRGRRLSRNELQLRPDRARPGHDRPLRHPVRTPPRSPPCPRRCRRRSARCRRRPTGSTCTRWASRATARPTTPPPSSRPSTAHRVLYFPTGFYIVRDTIRLRPDTIVDRSPSWPDAVRPARLHGRLSGRGRAQARARSAAGWRRTSSAASGSTPATINPRATGILWMAGEASLMDDVQFHGGAGSYLPASVRNAFYSTGRGTSPFSFASPVRDSAQYPSLWVTHGGGGTFANIWTPDTHAQAGFYVSDTTTPGHVYELSNEHHLFNEIKLDHVENWDINAPQTEGEAASSPEAVSMEISWSKQHHDRQLPRLPRDAHARAVPRGGPPLQFLRHPLPERARQRGERLRHLRRERLRHVPAREQVPVRERDPGHDAPSGGARARVRRARHPGRSDDSHAA